MIKFIATPLIVAGLAAALVASIATPSSARNRWIGPAAGFAAGVVVGSAVANANAGYYGNPYYGNPYYSDPYYAQGSYAYQPYYTSTYPAYPGNYGYRQNQRCTGESAGSTSQGC
jgi:hypothetical protein